MYWAKHYRRFGNGLSLRTWTTLRDRLTSSSRSQHLALCIAKILHGPIHFGVSITMQIWGGFLTISKSWTLHVLIGICRSRLQLFVLCCCIARSFVIIELAKVFRWTSSQLAIGISTLFMVGNKRRSGEAANIFWYRLYASFLLFSRIAFTKTGRNSYYSVSRSTDIRNIGLLNVCTIPSVRPFDYWSIQVWLCFLCFMFYCLFPCRW